MTRRRTAELLGSGDAYREAGRRNGHSLNPRRKIARVSGPFSSVRASRPGNKPTAPGAMTYGLRVLPAPWFAGLDGELIPACDPIRTVPPGSRSGQRSLIRLP